MVRWLNNLALTALDYAMLIVLAPVFMLILVRILGLRETGLLHWLGAGPMVSFLVVLLLFELFNYWVHRAFHSIPLLWRIHAVHHSDTQVDATTAHRHHPFELIISTLLAMPLLVVLIPDPLVMMAYNVVRLALAGLTHANCSLPPAMDRMARYLFVTPDFHRLHHHAERCYTDSNYSGILTLFDRLFGTARDLPREAHLTMRLGLQEFREVRDARLDRLLLMPFSRLFDRALQGTR